MKIRIFTAILAFVLLITVIPGHAYASNDWENIENVINLEDGSYITISTEEIPTRASGTKTGRRTYTYKDSNNVEQWVAVLTASFSYTGSSSTCTSASCSVTVSDSDWYEKSNTTTRSGNTATTELAMGQKFWGITVSTHSYTLTLSCDANGNLS